MALFLILRRLVSVVYLMKHPAVPLRLKVLPVLAVLYVLMPRDLILDFRFPFGHLDDMIVVTVLLGIFSTRGWHHVLNSRKGKDERRKGTIAVEFEVLDESEGQPHSEGQPKDPPSSDLRG